MDVELSLIDDLYREVIKIKEKYHTYKSLLNLYRSTEKLIITVNCANILYSIFICDKILIFLTIFSLATNLHLARLQKHIIDLEKLVPAYGNKIIPAIDDFIRRDIATCRLTHILERGVRYIHKIENDNLLYSMGGDFVPSPSITSINYTQIIVIIVGSICCFVIIPTLYKVIPWSDLEKKISTI